MSTPNPVPQAPKPAPTPPTPSTLQTTASIRNYANGVYGPATMGPCTQLRGGNGLVITEYAQEAGKVISLAFTVSAAKNKLANAFKFVNETDGTTRVSRTASISTKPNDGVFLVKEPPQACQTDQFHCWYMSDKSPEINHHAQKLADGTYYYNFSRTDGSAGPAPVGHSESNK